MSNTAETELAAGRQERIREFMGRHRVARVNDLCRILGASPASVRRDLTDMEKRGLIHRVHGGAVANETRLDEPLFDDKASIAAREKQRIAKAALEYVKPGDSVFLDGGSTVLALARLIHEMTRLTVVTNSLRIASLLSGAGPRLIVAGGELRRLSQTFTGSLTRPLLDVLHIDAAFMGTIGFSTKDGLTTTDPGEAHTKSLVMSHAGRVILMADSSKFQKTSFVKFGDINDVDVLVTDTGLPQSAAREIRNAGAKVLTA